eukprot:gene21282-23353_t
MDKLIQYGRELGLEGRHLQKFIEMQQSMERDERAENRRAELAKLEFQFAIEKEKKEILEKEQLRIQTVLELKNEGVDMSYDLQGMGGRQRAKGPKLPAFVDGKDDLDSYLKRFERFATINGWEKYEWATALSALLTGKALDVYSRMPEDTVLDYDKVKEALLIRYQLTKEGFKKRYRDSDPEEGETPAQFYARIDGYLDRWVELSGTEKSYQGLKELINKEQFISRCQQDLAIYLKEVAPRDHSEMTKHAQQFLSAHGKQLARKKNRVGHNSESTAGLVSSSTKPKEFGDYYYSPIQEKNGILHRVYSHPKVNGGIEIRQVVVPKDLRSQVIELAHNSLMGGHMGIRKTSDRVLSSFYWPGLKGDVTRFCRTCDICQETESKGKTSKVPLQKMPLIDIPFKRVAIDLIGPIFPSSEKGYRYILTMVDYATRYNDAVPLKNIDTETVAEALLDMYSRLSFPEEILSDNGTQFISECMEEVSRLLSIKQLTSMPYHPMCNGLVEKFNGTLKAMLRRLCNEQPRQWPRYINAVLFAYREVPQESTGFSPFELLYG